MYVSIVLNYSIFHRHVMEIDERSKLLLKIAKTAPKKHEISVKNVKNFKSIEYVKELTLNFIAFTNRF